MDLLFVTCSLHVVTERGAEQREVVTIDAWKMVLSTQMPLPGDYLGKNHFTLLLDKPAWDEEIIQRVVALAAIASELNSTCLIHTLERDVKTHSQEEMTKIYPSSYKPENSSAEVPPGGRGLLTGLEGMPGKSSLSMDNGFPISSDTEAPFSSLPQLERSRPVQIAEATYS